MHEHNGYAPHSHEVRADHGGVHWDRKVADVSERNRIVYVTSDASDWLAVDVPFGLITPPTIQLHRPLAGPVEFYHADSYRLPIPGEAAQVPGQSGTGD